MTAPNCRNDGHRPRPAVALVSWPDKRFRPDKDPACASCLNDLIRGYVRGWEGERHPVLIEPIEGVS